MVGIDLLLAVACSQQLHKVSLKLAREVVDELPAVFTDHHHIANMRFRRDMAFEAVVVAALFFADLAVPSQSLEAFGLELIGNRFCCPRFCARHGGQLLSKTVEEQRRNEWLCEERSGQRWD